MRNIFSESIDIGSIVHINGLKYNFLIFKIVYSKFFRSQINDYKAIDMRDLCYLPNHNVNDIINKLNGLTGLYNIRVFTIHWADAVKVGEYSEYIKDNISLSDWMV